ncbi:MAG: adenylate/guanylate cyclase domain-containing protein [Ignavibacteria bacterium]|nr:adenylate/guanylate cyclase domain-containing protein [Ignavibacteria bacterium]MBT8383488.1 adenylate/guanylate cyclase domain-containing protein [Ignavibacteria bacterium]MBT8393100.1 adenylate/guanylate cyclase domain-containing protein [Ignavibacteria bacterium]NNJ52151.1 adenylate/guanylate cyclase domain-containing protein [Ignavibacteriaceae bacterium]NNL21904.1 adenylate/guanylate cyclase domain-containing protein [Ignavibacteriaceae bacterium]
MSKLDYKFNSLLISFMKLDYSTTARGFYLRHPLIADILTQINFWIIAYIIFFTILFFVSKAITSLYPQKVEVYLWENILVAVIAATILGALLGTVDFFVERKLRGKSLGIEILVKGVLYLATWYFIGFVGYTIGTSMDTKFVDSPLLTYTEFFSGNMFIAASIYTATIIVIITFIKQMNNKFGPGILIPMFLGRFRKPRIEERIFLFMDLKDSTTYAEKLGHLKFSEMIQDCFLDVNKVIPPFNAEIYQYVGDEVVLSWSSIEGLRKMNCIKFFFAFQRNLQKRKDYYEMKYGFLPQFKSGANLGTVTVAEVGDFKREIAYHGDTVNTAARIQSVCNTYSRSFIISENLKNKIEWEDSFSTEFIDSIKLKGKELEIKLYSVTTNDSSL